MAINKAMRAALKALSYPDIDLKKNYKLVRMAENVSHPPANKLFYKAWDHVVPCGDHEVAVRIFAPRDSLPQTKILLFFHGGGWVTGNIDSYDKVCTDMARLTRHTVVSVDYRLAPEHRFPAGPEDCYLAARELFTHSEPAGHHARSNHPDWRQRRRQSGCCGLADGARPRRISSAAADFTLPCHHNDHTENSPFDSVRTNGKGYLLTSKRMVDYMALYRSSDEDLQNPYYAPILCSDLSDQPRTLIITAEFDPLRDEGEAYGEKLREFGNDVEIHRIHDALHGFMSLSPGFKPVKRTYRYINDFLSGRSDSFGQVLASVADQEDEPEETVIMDKEVNELE